jgi:hypothetical protein
MIHHISIAAHHPQHVTQVLAELLQGQSAPFPGHPGSYVAIALDLEGTMIEVHPLGTVLTQNGEESQRQHNSFSSGYTATHAAISVAMSEAQIQSIAAREGWHVRRCDRRGYFSVIEFWLENQVLVELLTPELTAQYLAFMEPRSLAQFAAQSIA